MFMKTKTINLIQQILICFIITTVSGVCYAKEVRFPGSQYADRSWQVAIPGVEGKQLQFTPEEMEVCIGNDSCEHIKRWDDEDAEESEDEYSNSVRLGTNILIDMRCEDDNSSLIKVFDFDGKKQPTIKCPTSKRIDINYYRPKNKYKDACTLVGKVDEITPPAETAAATAVVPVV